MFLTPQDFQTLLTVVRLSTPRTFQDGKQLVVLEGKILQTLQAYADAEQAKAKEQLKAELEAETLPDFEDAVEVFEDEDG